MFINGTFFKELARKIAKVCKDAKLDIDEDNYVERFKPFLMDVCYEWSRGASFYQICKMTDIFEGKYYLLLIMYF